MKKLLLTAAAAVGALAMAGGVAMASNVEDVLAAPFVGVMSGADDAANVAAEAPVILQPVVGLATFLLAGVGHMVVDTGTAIATLD